MAQSHALIQDLVFDELLPNAKFSELHKKVVAKPAEQVWPHVLAVSASQVRAIGPLFAIRGLPRMLTGAKPPTVSGDTPLLSLFEREGFVLLRKDEEVTNGRASVIFGAAGKFWSIAHNTPKRFDSPQAFLDFNQPGYAKTVCRVEVMADGLATRIETETLIAGTDNESDSKFAPYWLIIRGPSGLIRRSWLSAIARRAS